MEWVVVLIMVMIFIAIPWNGSPRNRKNDEEIAKVYEQPIRHKPIIRPQTRPENQGILIEPKENSTKAEFIDEILIAAHDQYATPEITIVRKRIREVVEQHNVAICALHGLARIDGKTTESERTMIFDFLNRQGANLTPTHREWFYTSRSGEWNRAMEDKIIDELMLSIMDLPVGYRADILMTAMAIVASGGTPRKREAEMLEKIRVACNHDRIAG